MGWLEQIRESFDLHGARGPTRDGDFNLCCPFCEEREGKPDIKFKLSCNPTVRAPDGTAGGWRCFRCAKAGWGGIEFLGQPDAVKRDVGTPYLAQPAGFHAFRENGKAQVLEPFRQYLRKRQVWEQALAIGAGACLEGRLAGRVVIPYVEQEQWLGWSARQVTTQAGPRYLYPPGMDRRHALWGLEWMPDDGQPCWVVEGVFDALPLFPYGICTFGKNVSDEQVVRLAGLGRPIVCALDGDAWLEAKILASRLRLRGAQDVDWCRLPPTTDPGSLGWQVKKYRQSIQQ